MTKLITLEISEETENKIKAVIEGDPFELTRGDKALTIVAQLYSDLNIGNKREER